MLEKNDYNTKVIEPTRKKSKKKSSKKKTAITRTFRFPLHGVAVEATSVEEAEKKLSEIINQD